jgi:hypothetical protein
VSGCGRARYQLGNLFAANIAVVESKLAEWIGGAGGRPDYASAMALCALLIFLTLILLASLGREAHGIEF